MPIMNRVGTAVTPPTHHYTNKLTHGYQVIIDAYGIASYQEINPGNSGEVKLTEIARRVSIDTTQAIDSPKDCCKFTVLL